MGFILGLIPFFLGALFFHRPEPWGVKEVGDGRLDATEIRWVGACVDRLFDFVESITECPSCVLCQKVVADGRDAVKNSRLLGSHLSHKDFQVKGLGKVDGRSKFRVFEEGFPGIDLRNP